MAGIFTLESSLNFIFHCPKFIVRKILNILRCVGKKTAQKIVIHLQDKFPSYGDYQPTGSSNKDDEVIESLVALGFSVIEAQTAVQSIPKDFSEDVEDRLRHALQFFSGR